MPRTFVRTAALTTIVVFMLVGVHSSASAQYRVTELTSNQPGHAPTTDPNLINAWGLAYGPGGPFWLSDNGTGLSTLYDGKGVTQGLVVHNPSSLR